MSFRRAHTGPLSRRCRVGHDVTLDKERPALWLASRPKGIQALLGIVKETGMAEALGDLTAIFSGLAGDHPQF